MSIATVAIIDHGHRIEDVNNIPKLLIQESGAHWQWQLEEDSPSKEIMQHGSVTLVIKPELFFVGARAMAIYMPAAMKWNIFLTSPEQQNYAIFSVTRIAILLNSPFAIFLPDSEFPISAALDMVSSSNNLDEISEFLLDRYGPPSKTPIQIYSEDSKGHWSGNGYYRLAVNA